MNRAAAELAKFGDECGADLMPGPHGYIHGWQYVGGPGLPGHDAVKEAPHTKGALAAVRAANDKQIKSEQLRTGPHGRLAALQQEARGAGVLNDLTGAGHQSELVSLYHSGTLFGSKPRGDFTPDDLVAQRRYVRSVSINDKLRAGQTPEGTAALDAAVHRHHVQSDTKVFRGIDAGMAGRLKPGDHVTDQGYLSASLDPRIAARFGKLLSISVPAGTPAAWFPNQRTDTPTDTEYELLLPRQSKLRVTKIDNDMVHAELIRRG